jgi:hypothetical protein
VISAWRKLHNEELHNLCFSPSITTIVKSKRMEQAGHVARIVVIDIGHWWESQKERDH